MEYEKTLKSQGTILAELQVLCPVVTFAECTGTSLRVETSEAINDNEKEALASYSPFTMEAV